MPKIKEDQHRMCIMCRRIATPELLLRFVRAPDGTLAFDVKGRLPGRGAYVCANVKCLERAVQRRAFFRAFDEDVIVGWPELMNDVDHVLRKYVLDNLGLALVAGQCVAGRTKAFEKVAKGEATALLVASDLTERSTKDLGLDTCQIDVLVGPSKEQLGAALGKVETGVVALLKGRISDRVVNDLRRFQVVLGVRNG